MAVFMSVRLNACFRHFRTFGVFSTTCRNFNSKRAYNNSFLFNGFACNGYRRCKTKLFVTSAVLGFSLFTANKPDKSEADSMKPEDVQKILSGENQRQDQEIIGLLKRARLAEMKQELEQADELYHRALGLVHINEQHKTWPAERVIQTRVYIYDSMANLAFLRGRFEAAEKLFKQTMQGLLQQGLKQDDNALVEISLKLAMIYALQQRLSEAEQGYQFCIKTQERKLNAGRDNVDDDSVALLGMSVDAYSRFLVVQKRYGPALLNLQRALDIAISILGENHQQVAVLLNDIATVASLTNDFDMARDKLCRAIAIAEQMDSLHLPTLYCNLGAVYLHTADYKAAKDSYNKAIKLAKQKKDTEVLEKAQTAFNNMKANKQL